MKKEIKNLGQKISALIESQRKVTHIDRMRIIIDSDDGKQIYADDCIRSSPSTET